LKKPWAKGLLNAYCAEAQRIGMTWLAGLEGNRPLRLSHPRWLQKQLKADWPEHGRPICNAKQSASPDDARSIAENHRETYCSNFRMLQGCPTHALAAVASRLARPLLMCSSCPIFSLGAVSVQD